MSSDHAYDIDKSIRIYMMVFGSLMFLTFVTVAIAYIHFPTPIAITLALIVATTKGTLVALYFMHLVDEQAFIYIVMGLATAFFFVLLLLPIFTTMDPILN